jgi:hypothetical protein
MVQRQSDILEKLTQHVYGGFLVVLYFNPEDGGDMLLWNNRLSLNHTALQPREPLLIIPIAERTLNPPLS